MVKIFESPGFYTVARFFFAKKSPLIIQRTIVIIIKSLLNTGFFFHSPMVGHIRDIICLIRP